MAEPTMAAAVYFGQEDVRIERVPMPQRRPGEALIQVVRSGMCGTDASEWRSGPHIFPVHKPHKITGHVGPFILGHEFVGRIVELDDDAAFSVGDVVASGAGVSCGECARCIEGRTNLCERYYTLGLNASGGMAEYVSCPISTLVRVPAGLDVDFAGLAQPLAVGIHAARRAQAANGDKVTIIGGGAIGTFVLAGLLTLADVEITVRDFGGERLARAKRLGATSTIAIDDDTARPQVRADVVIEASGARGQLDAALNLVRDGGTILQVGLPGSEQSVDVHQMVMREVTIRSTLAHVCHEDLEPALAILASTTIGAEMLDSVRPLAELPAQLARIATGKLEGKVLFDPQLH